MRKCYTLSAADLWLIACSFVYLLLFDIALRTLGFQRTIKLAGATIRPAMRSVDAEDLFRAKQYARWLDAASRHHFVPAFCLHRSLVLHYWLCREGLPSVLGIGVLKEEAALKAHAWVELGGMVVNDRPSFVATFTPIARLSGLPSSCSSGIRDWRITQPAGKGT